MAGLKWPLEPALHCPGCPGILALQAVGCPTPSPGGGTRGSLPRDAGQAYGCAELGNSVLYSSWKVRSLNLRTARAALRLCQERAGVRPAGRPASVGRRAPIALL